MNFRKQQREHAPIYIDGTAEEKVESFKFLGVHITDHLKWSTHTDSVVKKAQQHLFNLRRLKKFALALKPAPPATAGLSSGWCGLPNASPGANYFPS